MIDYRPFRNTDPPAICEIWRSHPPVRAFFQPMTPSVLENTVLCRPFFDRQGFIVATDQGHPVGFVHAGFGPDSIGAAIETSVGATCLLMVAPHEKRREIADQLLLRSEAFLVGGGATTLYGGSVRSLAPFYLGLYGGAGLPGVLTSDRATLEFYHDSGYAEAGRNCILHRQLVGFRPPVDRQQIQIRRGYVVEPARDPLPLTWWEACTEGLCDRFAYVVRPRNGGDVRATIVYWDIEPLASSWGVHARGLTRLDVQEDDEQDALATFLLAESMRIMSLDGVTLAEVQTASGDRRLGQVLSKLGFQFVEEGIELRKVAGG